jgi:pyruvate formate lyase activating enzyme
VSDEERIEGGGIAMSSLRVPDHSAREALLWKAWKGGPTVHCFLCAHHCRVAPGERGLCGVRENREGVLFTLVYDCPVSTAVDPIEKKPLFHFLPGTRSYSIATVGCNFTCKFCQNADISQMPRDQGRIVGARMTADEVVREALHEDCRSIAYTYTEPTIYFEYALDCARKASAVGLKNVFVTNGYMTAAALQMLGPDLHAANVDLKAFSDAYYREVVGARLKPVKDSIKRMYEAGVWVEVTTLLVPGHNDDEKELTELAEFLVSLSPDIPWHVSRFYPTYRMLDVLPTSLATVEKAVRIGREAGLRFVFAGNLPGHDSESTLCPNCGHRVIGRHGFEVIDRNMVDGACGNCGTSLPIIEEDRP